MLQHQQRKLHINGLPRGSILAQNYNTQFDIK